MPRARKPKRIELLATAHERLLESQAALKEINLLDTHGAQRIAIQAARRAVDTGLQATERSIRLDIPKTL